MVATGLLLLAAAAIDVEQAASPGLHPGAILIRQGTPPDLPKLLAATGCTAFTITPRLAPDADWRQATGDIRRSIREIRHHAARWRVDPDRIALIGFSSSGYLANLAGLMAPDADRRAKDPVERESAAVQAVVAAGAFADLRGQRLPHDLRALLARDIERMGESLALAGASPVMHMRDSAPPYLLIHGDLDETVPMAQSAHWQLALQNRGIRADLILIENGGAQPESWSKTPGARDWRREMIQWLAAVLALR